jgi:cobalt-zinc-cadmium efflux system outer membrane protein
MRPFRPWMLLTLGMGLGSVASATPPADQPAPEAPAEGVPANPEEMGLPPALDAAPPMPAPGGLAPATAPAGGQPLTLQAALYGALTGNPDLIALRQGTVASAEAVAVARRFPVTLNPTLWVDVRPLVYERDPGRGLNQKDALMYFSLRQPIELGHQTTHRTAIAQAAFTQQRWTVVQAELMAMVQTYRFFQTAAYRRERLQIAERLADFSDRLVQTLRRRLEAGQVTAADVALAAVEARATRQLVQAARQDYVTALTDLRNQLGIPETAAAAEPLGEFLLPASISPVDDQALIATALRSRPEIHTARAQAAGARAAVCLARADRLPTPVVGPTYERDENGTQFFGFVYITPIPLLNNGAPLVRQREAEYRRAVVNLQQIERRTVAQVRAAAARWNGASALVGETAGLASEVARDVATLERLFEAGQTDLTKLLQARQRLIQLENARLDATWQATQAQADLLAALGAPTLLAALANPPASAAPPPAPTPPPVRSPSR